MSSPLTRSNSRSSPARRTPNGFPRSQTNGYHSPFRHNTESPSRQLVEEFSKVYLDEERLYKQKLDEHSEEQEKLHREALSKSLQKHEEVRQSVERAQERLQLELDRVKRERLEQEQTALERQRREAAEAEVAAKQREIDEAKQRESELKQAAAKQKELEDTQTRIEHQKRQEANENAKREAERVRKLEAEKKAKDEAAAAAERARTSAPPTPSGTTQSQAKAPRPQPNGVQTTAPPAATVPAQVSAASPAPITAAGTGALIPNSIQTSSDAKEVEHKRYLDLHTRLKEMCKNTEAQAKSLRLNNKLSDLRRTFTKIVGQINKHDKKANSEGMKKILAMLTESRQMTEIMFDVTPFIVSTDATQLQEGDAGKQVPGALLYLLHHLVKAVFKQFTTEVARDTGAADPLGILVVTIFANPASRFKGFPMTDVLWAKYHKCCPVLFGISGPENTFQGRRRLGWRMSVIKDADNKPTNQVSEVDKSEHYDRMTGYAAAFAAITLRDFKKSTNSSPAPNHLFWTALARVINTPNSEQTITHYVVLYHMLKLHTNRFILFYGGAAIAALKKACVDFPAGGGPLGSPSQPDSHVVAVKSLPMYYQSELKLTL